MKPIIAITAGDINGVGYEIILKGLYESYVTEVCTPVVYGNAKVLKTHLMTLDGEMHNMQFNVVKTIDEVKEGKLNLVTCYPDETPVQLGVSTPEAGKASFMSLERACADMKAGKVQALVTAPINKANIQSEQFTFSGHTEYLQSVFGNNEQECLMMMTSECMRVALVCNHTPITHVANMISEERILRKLRVLRKTLQDDFLIRRPRIAVLALNPHAGDEGLIGKEEQTVIAPAIQKANGEGIDAFGPYSADGFFGAGKYVHFDAVLAMYHDQGLIPFKSLDMSGVNFTAGLPIIRTSPDHGTAYDLAGKNEASALSFNHALYTAIDVLRNRATSAEINATPLVITEQPRPERPAGKFFIPPKEEFK
ncbi:MAG: 4-hydroxythreonine-4-phosphate dehydrogenase PdxA [Paludibacteraceae bacterium]|nr:4-hydroxythreonine-4-phosphate dehydrogenase PdxA [Paludibacteraceae bacterium]